MGLGFESGCEHKPFGKAAEPRRFHPSCVTWRLQTDRQADGYIRLKTVTGMQAADSRLQTYDYIRLHKVTDGYRHSTVAYRQVDRQTDRRTDRQTDKHHTYIHTDIQTDIQTDIHPVRPVEAYR